MRGGLWLCLGEIRAKRDDPRDALCRMRGRYEEHHEEREQLSADLSHLLERTGIALIVFDSDLRLRRWTSGAEALGLSLAPGLSVGEVLRGQSHADLEVEARRVLRDNELVEREILIDQEKAFLIRLAPAGSASAKGRGVAVTFVDISHRKRAEEILEQEKQLADRIVSSLPEPLLVLTSDLRVKTGNEAFLRHFGMVAAEVEGRSVFDLEDGKWNVAELRTLLERVGAGDSDVGKYEVSGRCEGLGEKAMLLSASKLKSEPIILLSLHDITGRKNVERALRTHQIRFRALIEQVRDYAIFMIDADRKGTSWNEGVSRVLGFEEEDFLGKDVTECIFTPEDLAAGIPDAEYEEAARAGSASNDRWMRRRDGTRFWASGITTALRDEDGALLGYMKVMRDLTESKKLEEELKRSTKRLAENDRKKDEFLAMLAHELRNPLSPITTGLELLRLAEDKAAVLQQVHGTMDRQAKHLVTLVDDLLDVSRITRGKLKLKKRLVTVAEVVADAVEGSRPFIDRGAHALSVRVPEESITLNADPHRLVQVLSNLLTNAARYTPGNGRIELSVVREGDEVVLAVEDNGLGIPAERQDEIFEMFTQMDHSVEETEGGLGIGLTLVKSLVELHGGSVAVQSEGRGRGSIFKVRLPTLAGSAPVSAELPASGAIPAFRARRILVVDDNRAAALTLGLLLQTFGHEVRSASDGLQAVEMAEQFDPEVVLMDIGMPEVDGYEAARRIRSHLWGKGMCLIALTGWGQEEDRRLSQEAGFDEHLVKPPDLNRLRALLGHT